ncbi:hypothetical protein D3C87_1028770 [compost metagenome]
MTNSKVTSLTDAIKGSMDAMANTHLLVSNLLKETDLRNVNEQFATEMGKSLQVSLINLEKMHDQQRRSIAQLAAVLYYKELELNKGSKGEWREIATAQKHYRVSLDAVRSLRETFGLNLVESRLVVEAFQAGTFE